MSDSLQEGLSGTLAGCPIVVDEITLDVDNAIFEGITLNTLRSKMGRYGIRPSAGFLCDWTGVLPSSVGFVDYPDPLDIKSYLHPGYIRYLDNQKRREDSRELKPPSWYLRLYGSRNDDVPRYRRDRRTFSAHKPCRSF